VPISGGLARGAAFEVVGLSSIQTAATLPDAASKLNPSAGSTQDSASAPDGKSFDAAGRDSKSKPKMTNEEAASVRDRISNDGHGKQKSTSDGAKPTDISRTPAAENSLLAAIIRVQSKQDSAVGSDRAAEAVAQAGVRPVLGERISDASAENESTILHKLRVSANLVIPAIVALSMVKISKARSKHTQEADPPSGTIPS
jgi:hypothetical protein